MKLRACVLFVITILVLAAAVATSADGITKRVKFARGKHSAVMSGAVVRGDRDTYILGAKGGQTMSVKITAVENNAVFQIEGPDGEYLAGAGDTDDAMQHSGTLPLDGDYKVIVGGTRGNVTYKLTVTIR